MSNTTAEKFVKCCYRILAAATSLPLMLVGIGIAIGGFFACLGMWFPGIILGITVALALQDRQLGEKVFYLVTAITVVLGYSLYNVGRAAQSYATQGDLFILDDFMNELSIMNP